MMPAGIQRWKETLGRSMPLVGIAAAIALCLTVYFRYEESSRQLADASRQLTECRRLAAEIRRLEAMPTFAAVDADSQREIARRIEQALRESQLPEDAVLRIQPPAQPFRLGDTPYQVFATRIELKQVSMRQLVRFAHALSDSQKGLAVRDVRLWTPRRDSEPTAETWSVEVTLTQLAFSPKTR